MRVLFIVISVTLSVLTYKYFFTKKESQKLCSFYPNFEAVNEKKYGRDFFIAHAGGSIHSYTYTNSLEAVKKSIETGYRFIEIDMMITTDGFIVGVHDWAHFNQITGYPDLGDQALSLREVESRKIRGQYTPITYKEIEKLFSNHKDLILVTDKIADFRKILSTFSFPDRIIVETFNREDYEKATEAGIRHPMYSLTEQDLESEYVKENQIPLVATPTKLLARYPEKFQELTSRGTCVFAYSTSEESFVKRVFEERLATGFYTDYWDVQTGKCGIAKSECKTY